MWEMKKKRMMSYTLKQNLQYVYPCYPSRLKLSSSTACVTVCQAQVMPV